jgi:SAM-dependent methyltransferase
LNDTAQIHLEFEPDSYFGQCSICGLFQEFVRAARSVRETYRCQACKASLREREQAGSILGCYGDLNANTLQELATMENFRKLSIYEPGTVGPFRKVFSSLPNYYQSDYYLEADRHKAIPSLPHQNLEALSYPDRSFDLIITSDILEHVRKPMQALAETYRVLKAGGYHVFTVPLQEPAPSKTLGRVDVSGDEDVFLLPAIYHGNGKGGRSLVYYDFGLDLVNMLEDVGFDTVLQNSISPSPHASRVITIIAKKD